jgi:acyl-CoA reductase-like NAD-dependent aldehyde dehydrogenase
VSTDTQTPARVDSPAPWRAAAEDDIAALAASKDTWARMPIAGRIELLRTLASNTSCHAERWVRAACGAKGLELTSTLAGEEWTSGRGRFCSVSTG